jgi:polysaccharide pyruvyl transferase WcaK-like protein
MKIGILTYHRAHNYGAMLQAYALRTYLHNQGHDVEFIDYWPDSHNKQYTLFKPIRGKSLYFKILNIISDSVTLIRRTIRMNKFNNFRKKHLGINDSIKYTTNKEPIIERYDCVVVGSDQIWRTQEYEGKHVGIDPMYLCTNIPNTTRCISYAASMGIISLTSEDEHVIRTSLKNFNTILVRENSLKQLVESLGYSAHVVLDPTLLLTKQQWDQLIPSHRYSQKPYVLFYELMPSQEALAFAKKKALSLNCELLIMDSIIHTLPRKNHISYASPIEFMHAIRDAEFVIATSFHGTAFSIIFEKQFITIGLKKNADRVKTLLQQVGITEQYQDQPIETSKINYKEVNTTLQTIREHSQQLLVKSIQ